eukprot:scaffold82128_cov25-Tisochrysis_lutea.AAC.1
MVQIQPTFISGGQWGPRAPSLHRRHPRASRQTPGWARTTNLSPCPLAARSAVAQSSFWPRPPYGRGPRFALSCPCWACPRADSPPSPVARHTRASGGGSYGRRGPS